MANTKKTTPFPSFPRRPLRLSGIRFSKQPTGVQKMRETDEIREKTHQQ